MFSVFAIKIFTLSSLANYKTIILEIFSLVFGQRFGKLWSSVVGQSINYDRIVNYGIVAKDLENYGLVTCG